MALRSSPSSAKVRLHSMLLLSNQFCAESQAIYQGKKGKSTKASYSSVWCKSGYLAVGRTARFRSWLRSWAPHKQVCFQQISVWKYTIHWHSKGDPLNSGFSLCCKSTVFALLVFRNSEQNCQILSCSDRQFSSGCERFTTQKVYNRLSCPEALLVNENNQEFQTALRASFAAAFAHTY